MFFARPNEYEPCGIFTTKHFILIILTIVAISIALKKTIHKSKEEVHKIIKKLTIIIWILEFVRIGFNLYIGNINNVNECLPLYYCSLLLYAGLMSSFGKGKIKRIGDVFLATGGIIGGIVFIIMPTTLTRPEITGTGFWNWLTSLIYSTDAADNLFPSIHCLESWILFRGVMRCEKQGTTMKIFMFVSAILVFASTVLIKQHVVIDIIGGVLVVEIGLFLAKKLNTKRIFYAIGNKLGLE